VKGEKKAILVAYPSLSPHQRKKTPSAGRGDRGKERGKGSRGVAFL